MVIDYFFNKFIPNFAWNHFSNKYNDLYLILNLKKKNNKIREYNNRYTT